MEKWREAGAEVEGGIPVEQYCRGKRVELWRMEKQWEDGRR